eukprot:jgi/Mesen1/10099/ME000074S09442
MSVDRGRTVLEGAKRHALALVHRMRLANPEASCVLASSDRPLCSGSGFGSRDPPSSSVPMASLARAAMRNVMDRAAAAPGRSIWTQGVVNSAGSTWQGRFYGTNADEATGSSSDSEGEKETISVTFLTREGDEKTIHVPIGMNMLEAAHENDIDLEGACEGSLACSTCHVILMDEEAYNKLPEPSDEENDMLDLAFGLTETSRLGCQVIAEKELDGLRLVLPSATRNFAVDGHKPKPH